MFTKIYIEYGRVVVETKSPQTKKMQKIQNLIYMIVYPNGVHRIQYNCCWDKIPPPQKNLKSTKLDLDECLS